MKTEIFTGVLQHLFQVPKIRLFNNDESNSQNELKISKFLNLLFE